jgi:hypothetical protein
VGKAPDQAAGIQYQVFNITPDIPRVLGFDLFFYRFQVDQLRRKNYKNNENA